MLYAVMSTETGKNSRVKIPGITKCLTAARVKALEVAQAKYGMTNVSAR